MEALPDYKTFFSYVKNHGTFRREHPFREKRSPYQQRFTLLAGVMNAVRAGGARASLFADLPGLPELHSRAPSQPDGAGTHPRFALMLPSKNDGSMLREGKSFC
jgi:hypothetical protein